MLVDKVTAAHGFWRFSQRCRTLPVGKTLRIEVVADAIIRWTADGWQTWQDKSTLDSGLGLHFADLATASLAAGTAVEFTLFWRQADHWEGQNFALAVVA